MISHMELKLVCFTVSLGSNLLDLYNLILNRHARDPLLLLDYGGREVFEETHVLDKSRQLWEQEVFD